MRGAEMATGCFLGTSDEDLRQQPDVKSETPGYVIQAASICNEKKLFFPNRDFVSPAAEP